MWAKPGRLVYRAGDIELRNLPEEPGAECRKLVFESSPWKPEIIGGVLREESLAVLAPHFAKDQKG